MASDSHKSKKYDRQIRLWGEHGQLALENASICLIGAGALGAEILKNIILPGVGSFTVVDGARVCQEDFGVNFFVEMKFLGESRAKAVTELLQELNPDVIGDYVEEDINTLVKNNISFFKKFSCVIATEISDRSLLLLDQLLYTSGIPLVICRSFGMVSYLRIVVREHTVVESRPDNYVEDLRLDRPWRQLSEFCASQCLETMTPRQQSHTPWLVLLFKAVENWKSTHEGRFPATYSEKRELKSKLEEYYKRVKVAQVAAQRGEGTLEEGEVDDMNLQEVLAAANSALQISRVPSSVVTILKEASSRCLEQLDSPFWVMARAVSEFVECPDEGAGCLPLRGSLPDMTADTERFVQLQRIYRERAKHDAELVERRVQRILQEMPVAQTQQDADSLSPNSVAHFSRNSAFLQLLRTGSLNTDQSVCSPELLSALQDPETSSPAAWWLALLLAAHKYREEHGGRWPSSTSMDGPGLRAATARVLSEQLGVSPTMAATLPSAPDSLVLEVCKTADTQLHCTAAWMGGVAAQEVIKLLVHQFIPLDNTLVYESIGQTATVFKL